MRRDRDGSDGAPDRSIRDWIMRMVIALALPLCLAIGVAVAQEGRVADREQEPVVEEGTYVGPASCAASGCHGSPVPVEDAEILMNEYDAWLHAPAPTHVRAWEVLVTPLSQRIARNLDLPNPPESSPTCT
ncbi:MAG: hypothetical protein R3338_01055, partial [Thermoanaerobaculia bacterium]|nr:hypothetical protein [Thermoanaerobaculia bacterium]